MEMKRKKISVTSLILPVIMLVVAVVLPMIYSTNYYIQLFSQTLINLVAVLGLNVVMGLAGQTNLGTIALVALGSYTSALISQATGSTNLVGLLAALVVAVLVGFMLGLPKSPRQRHLPVPDYHVRCTDRLLAGQQHAVADRPAPWA